MVTDCARSAGSAHLYCSVLCNIVPLVHAKLHLCCEVLIVCYAYEICGSWKALCRMLDGVNGSDVVWRCETCQAGQASRIWLYQSASNLPSFWLRLDCHEPYSSILAFIFSQIRTGSSQVDHVSGSLTTTTIPFAFVMSLSLSSIFPLRVVSGKRRYSGYRGISNAG